MIYKNLARQLIMPMYAGDRVRYEAGKIRNRKTEMLVMIALYEEKEICPSALCRTVHASSPRMAVVLRTLEERRWIIRTPDPDDCRKTRITATEEGLLAAAECISEIEDQMSESLSLLGEDDAKEYVRLQTKLSDQIAEKHRKRGRFSK